MEDLQHELQTVNRRVSREYDDEVKEDGKDARRRQGFGDAIAVNVNVGVHGDNGGGSGDANDEQPLLGKAGGDEVEVEEKGRKKRSHRHRKNGSVERIGQTPREFFLDNHWACGFVCCDHAFGFGSY